MSRRRVTIAVVVTIALAAVGVLVGIALGIGETTGTVTASIPDQTVTIPGTTTIVTYTIPTVTVTNPPPPPTTTEPPPPPPPPGYIKTLNSTNSKPVGLSSDSNHCSLTHDGLGDTFTMQTNSTRCTWTNQHFSHMHRHEVFEVSERFDNRPHIATDWENEIMLRPNGSFGNADCSDGGNHEVMLINVYVNRQVTPERWQLDIRGGTSLNLSDQVGPSREDPLRPPVVIGPVVQGETLALKFDLVADYQHGAATVWRDGTVIYDNRDRPLGFHYDCNRSTDISNFDLRMQHGVYRGWTGYPLTFTSSGFGFLVSEPQP